MALQQLAEGEAHKEQGNRLFAEGSWKKALGAYHKVFCYVNGLQEPPQRPAGDAAQSLSSNQIPKERVDDLRRLKQTTRLNMAACYLKLGEYQKCVDACTSALEFGESSKAHFRRGQAYIELRNFGGARSDLERARDLVPEDRAIVAELRRAREAESKGDARERKQFAKMFPSESPATAAAPPEAAAAGDASAPPPADPPAAAPLGTEGRAASPALRPEAEAGAATEGGAKGPPGAAAELCQQTQAPDESRKFDMTVRSLKYSWQQSEGDIKVYITFDQEEELQRGVKESQVEVEFGEWSFSLLIHTDEKRPPLGLRLGDFHRRLAPEACRLAVRDNKISIKLVKQTKEHWWNLLQSVPLHAG